jgi:hypothetical protein
MRKRLAALIAMGALAIAMAPTTASAYCDPAYYETTGRCTNSCVESARAFKKVTGKDAPWLCPM